MPFVDLMPEDTPVVADGSSSGGLVIVGPALEDGGTVADGSSSGGLVIVGPALEDGGTVADGSSSGGLVIVGPALEDGGTVADVSSSGGLVIVGPALEDGGTVVTFVVWLSCRTEFTAPTVLDRTFDETKTVSTVPAPPLRSIRAPPSSAVNLF